jgi:UDP-N-acetylmuramate dehydrogenase
LIELAGLKGAREGGAQISSLHANFIVNTGNATAADVTTLIERARDAVREQRGIELEPEVRIVGRPG